MFKIKENKNINENMVYAMIDEDKTFLNYSDNKFSTSRNVEANTICEAGCLTLAGKLHKLGAKKRPTLTYADGMDLICVEFKLNGELTQMTIFKEHLPFVTYIMLEEGQALSNEILESLHHVFGIYESNFPINTEWDGEEFKLVRRVDYSGYAQVTFLAFENNSGKKFVIKVEGNTPNYEELVKIKNIYYYGL